MKKYQVDRAMMFFSSLTIMFSFLIVISTECQLLFAALITLFSIISIPFSMMEYNTAVPFKKEDWILTTDDDYECLVEYEKHGLTRNPNCVVQGSCGEGLFSPVFPNIIVDEKGNIEIRSSEPFDGRVIVK